LREFYPPEVSDERCHAYNDERLERPTETLQRAYEETADQRGPSELTVQWYTGSSPISDSTIIIPDRQGTKYPPDRVVYSVLAGFDGSSVKSGPGGSDPAYSTSIKRRFERAGYPLVHGDAGNTQNIPQRVVDLCQQWGANHLYANLEYVVDELRREARPVKLCVKNGIKLETAHDACVVPPEQVTSRQGKQYVVYTL
jgi:deoxyribodipyrimidine photo-lyase